MTMIMTIIIFDNKNQYILINVWGVLFLIKRIPVLLKKMIYNSIIIGTYCYYKIYKQIYSFENIF